MANSVEDPVVVVPYDDAWPSLFEEERDRIEQAIGPWVEEIQHVGSTAVSGLAAKPVRLRKMDIRRDGVARGPLGRVEAAMG